MSRTSRKRKEAREKHLAAKRRARVNRLVDEYCYRWDWAHTKPDDIDSLMFKLEGLNTKYLTEMLIMLNNRDFYFSDRTNDILHERVTSLVLERTMLK